MIRPRHAMEGTRCHNSTRIFRNLCSSSRSAANLFLFHSLLPTATAETSPRGGRLEHYEVGGGGIGLGGNGNAIRQLLHTQTFVEQMTSSRLFSLSRANATYLGIKCSRFWMTCSHCGGAGSTQRSSLSLSLSLSLRWISPPHQEKDTVAQK